MLENLKENQVVHIDDHLSLEIRGRFLLGSWFGAPSIKSIDALNDWVVGLVAKKDICSIIMILEEGATPPSPELRARSTLQHDDMAECIDCFSFFIPDTGIKSSIKAILAKTMQRSTRNLWKQSIKQTQGALVDWLVKNESSEPTAEWLHKVLSEHRQANALYRGIS